MCSLAIKEKHLPNQHVSGKSLPMSDPVGKVTGYHRQKEAILSFFINCLKLHYKALGVGG